MACSSTASSTVAVAAPVARAVRGYVRRLASGGPRTPDPRGDVCHTVRVDIVVAVTLRSDMAAQPTSAMNGVEAMAQLGVTADLLTADERRQPDGNGFLL